jgi:methionine synthase I (cobalamin-dependent)
MSRITEWLSQRPLITDGAWGTELQKLGLRIGELPDTWNLSHPESVAAIARAYAEAGSEVILTNTFRANAIAMKGTSDTQLDEINRAGVEISKSATTNSLVFASIGPVGKLIASGEVNEEEIAVAFALQSQSLAAAGADALLIETMSDIEEARLAVGAARATGLPVIVSFAFDTGKNKERTFTGATPEKVAISMAEAGADAVGANCGVGVEQAVAICARLRAACDLPIWMKPNAGLPIMEEAVARYATTPLFFASHFAAFRDAGAAFLGSCCGSTPEFIRALVAARAQSESKRATC